MALVVFIADLQIVASRPEIAALLHFNLASVM
jgi:hypothetical protein